MPTNKKWVQTHSAFRKKLGVGASTSYAASDALDLANERQRDAWQLLVDAHPGKNITADLSQNVDRARVTATGVCPAITPHSMIYVQAANRRIMPIETLALHFFPIHRMKITTRVKPETLASLGVNTMHLKSVGAIVARTLSYEACEFALIEDVSDDSVRKIYNDAANLWSK